jgi:hypothetical protein
MAKMLGCAGGPGGPSVSDERHNVSMGHRNVHKRDPERYSTLRVTHLR